jgi:hypothetical protein
VKTSETVVKIFQALISFQAEVKPAEKNGKNPFFSSSYSTLQDVFESIKPGMKLNKLGVIQSPELYETQEGKFIKVVSRVIHESGEWIEGEVSASLKDANPQTIGSAISYLRRYSLISLFGIASEDDDDGNAATDNTPKEIKQDPVDTGKQQKQPDSSKPQKYPGKWIIAFKLTPDQVKNAPLCEKETRKATSGKLFDWYLIPDNWDDVIPQGEGQVQ